ncbi:sulfonate ABC transporter ATP-binding lipoprotein [Nitratireductor aestuarii]|uniref:Sulfonate ABC transporter ATP-binding lipoprotein n=1 Tax=Nitratireductor aestuarii TaxID=1735103 RepID=A0A916RKL7_9HYPH|nr:ABC transporter ATP-binding protein [Nitratireductor aestuarii]GGA59944.1 sulfonate ABC transporter ATP-binding lipoprotein [Nitratireductor aestuarii]
MTMQSVAAGGGNNNSITLNGAEKYFGVRGHGVQALTPTTLDIKGGEMTILLGPSGCGKTTMLRMIAGLETPTAGSIEVGGANLWSNGNRNVDALKQLGMVFQEANLFPWLTIEENIALPLKLRGIDKAGRQAKAAELCKLVGISGFEKRFPKELSGGMRQRAAIARALSYDPNILLMDEPFGALDAITRDTMNGELQRIWMETGKTVVLVTHSITEAVFLASRIILLSPRPGRVQEIIDVPFERPRDSSIHKLPEFQSIVAHLRTQLEH